MREITRDQATEFIDLLSVLPIGASNQRFKAFRGKTIREIAAKTVAKLEKIKQRKPGQKAIEKIRVLDAATVNKFISEADAFWEWCVFQERDLHSQKLLLQTKCIQVAPH